MVNQMFADAINWLLANLTKSNVQNQNIFKFKGAVIFHGNDPECNLKSVTIH